MKKYLLVIIGTLFFIVFLSRVGFDKIGTTLGSVNIIYIIPVVSLNLPVLLLKTWRWKFLLSKYDLSPAFWDMFTAVSAGFFLGLVTPGTLGELSRTATINIDKSKGIGTVMYEKFLDLLTLFLLSIGSLLFYFIDPFKSSIIIFIICFISMGSIYILAKKESTLDFILKYSSRFKLTSKLNVPFQIFNTLLQDMKLVLLSSFVSLTLWSISAVQFYLILKALNITPSLEMVNICYFLPYIAGVISFIPLGLGVLDFSMVGIITNLYNVPTSVGYSSALMLRVLTTFLLVIWGYCCYLYLIIYAKKTKVRMKSVNE